MNNKLAIKKMFSVFFLWAIPMLTIALLVWSYLVNYQTLVRIPDFKKDYLQFEKYDSSISGDGGTGELEAYGIAKNNLVNLKIKIGYYNNTTGTHSESYLDKGLDSLKEGDLIPIWYSKKEHFSEYRFKTEEIQDLYIKFWKHCVPIYGLYLLYLFLTIRFYKKYRKYDLNDLINQNNNNL